MVMKIFYVYREQFPIILAYAVTIHKCGLSLCCAIVDLSKCRYGLCGTVKSEITCWIEVRSDLPLCDIPSKSISSRITVTRNMTGKCDGDDSIKQD